MSQNSRKFQKVDTLCSTGKQHQQTYNEYIAYLQHW